MLKRRIRTPAVTGITIVAVALLTLSTAGASAAGPAPAASHVTDASATATHGQGVIHSIHRGLVKDCVEIELGNTGLEIWDDGAGQPVILEPAPASCWNLVNEFSVDFGGTYYTGYEYQDLRGDCLWDDAGTISTAAGPCKDLANYESFFGINYYHSGHNGPGWTFTDSYWGPSWYMAYDYVPNPFQDVLMTPSDYTDSHLWNFP
jgi:hypothetical protein